MGDQKMKGFWVRSKSNASFCQVKRHIKCVKWNCVKFDGVDILKTLGSVWNEKNKNNLEIWFPKVRPGKEVF